MKLFGYKRHEDFGTEHIFSILRGRNFSLLQVSVGWDDYASWPYIQVSSGNNSLLDVLFYVYRFSLSFELFARNWVHYLERMENGEVIEE
jgi:hypothetical protein